MKKSRTFAEKALLFYKNLRLSKKLPLGISVMNPYQEPIIQGYVASFLNKFFADTRKRVLVFGINPGRFGAGVTGVTFTDPVALARFCGINNDLPKVRERSSEFVYQFVESWGGPKKFYRNFFLTAVSPLGFIRNGINYNYYDDEKLFSTVRPFIVKTIRAQLDFGADRNAVILFGTGKNKKFFDELNHKHKFFKTVYALEHPRFIMQYRRRKLSNYLKKYRKVFSQALSA